MYYNFLNIKNIPNFNYKNAKFIKNVLFYNNSTFLQ